MPRINQPGRLWRDLPDLRDRLRRMPRHGAGGQPAGAAPDLSRAGHRVGGGGRTPGLVPEARTGSAGGQAMTTAQTIGDLHVDVHYLTRVEGHGHIVVDTVRGALERCELNVVAAPRFFEAMLVGRPYAQAAHLASRICGICSVAQTTVSLRSAEKALGVEVSPQTERLRRLAFP